jgi:hypothetical protein
VFFAKIGVFRENRRFLQKIHKNWRFAKISVFAKIGNFAKISVFAKIGVFAKLPGPYHKNRIPQKTFFPIFVIFLLPYNFCEKNFYFLCLQKLDSMKNFSQNWCFS